MGGIGESKDDGQCTIICTALNRGMLHWSRNGLCIRRSVI
jgi:hypothetical protein